MGHRHQTTNLNRENEDKKNENINYVAIFCNILVDKEHNVTCFNSQTILRGIKAIHFKVSMAFIVGTKKEALYTLYTY